MMKKLVLSVGVILVFIAYSIHERNEASQIHVSAPSTTTPATSNTSSGTANGAYKDGIYTGSIADAYYGNIQVQATIQSGKISDVTFLQYPNDRDESIQINTQAMPILKQEAITAQGSQVDVVSGATDSSQAFMQSLQNALSQAK